MQFVEMFRLFNLMRMFALKSLCLVMLRGVLRKTLCLLERRVFWVVVVCLCFLATMTAAIMMSVGHPWQSHDGLVVNGLRTLLYVACLAYSLWVFVIGNEWDWFYALQFLAFVVPVAIAILLFAQLTGSWAILYFSGFLFTSGWLFWKWVYHTIPEE